MKIPETAKDFAALIALHNPDAEVLERWLLVWLAGHLRAVDQRQESEVKT